MKPALIIPVIFLAAFTGGYEHLSSYKSKTVKEDSSAVVHILNSSSLKKLPSVVKDLLQAINEPAYRDGLFLEKNGLAVYLYDITCKSPENAAAIRYRINDTLYHLKLNRYNRFASDKALAATLIHEIMHCVLLDIRDRTKQEGPQNLPAVFGNAMSKDEFFTLMNSGDSGQHELIQRFFYKYMVSLMLHFAEIHHSAFKKDRDAERLMWAGLQETTAYQKLDEEEKKQIEVAILQAKGLVGGDDR